MSIHLLGLVARVRPDERRDALGAFVTLFGFMAGHALLETARDALFLASLPARRLPWVYLAIALIALAIGQREPRVIRRLSARNELGRWLFAAGLVTFAFWLVVGAQRSWALYSLYVWSGVLASLVMVRFWTVLGSRFTLTQAKRVFPVIASGSLAGAIFGSGLALTLTEFVPARHLVLAAAVTFIAASAAPALLGADDPSNRGRATLGDLGQVTRAIWTGPYLRRVAALVLLATVTFTLVDYIFKSVADRTVSPADFGQFFSGAYLTFNVVSLVIQVTVVAWLLRHAGLVRAILVVPAILVVGTLGFAVIGGLWLSLALKSADGTLRHSLHRTGTELLFIPLSERLRTQVKGVIDVLGQRGGQALASILILMLLSTTANEKIVAALACLTSVAWLVVAVGLREPYLNLFRETLRAESTPTGSGFPALDVASLETLLVTLNTADDRRVLAALEILSEQGKIGVVPALLLYHPSTAVVVRALDVFSAAGRDDILPMVRRLLGHGDSGVRAASLRAMAVLGPQENLLAEGLRDEDLSVVTTARTLLVGMDASREGDHEIELVDSLTRDDRVVVRAVAAALKARPDVALETVLLKLLSVEDSVALRDAIGAAGRLRSPSLFLPLLSSLSRRAVRDDARAALAGFGPATLGRLADALHDTSLPRSVRLQVPATIAMIGSSQAPDILLRHLQLEPDGMIRFKILRALGRWRREQPGFPLDTRLLQQALAHALSTGFRLMGWQRALSSAREHDETLGTELHEVLILLLRDKEDHALERIFRLLNLQSGSEEFQRVYRGLHSPHGPSRAGSRELLYHLVLPPIRLPLLTLVDDLHGDERLELPGWTDEVGSESYASVLSEIVACDMESASALAAAQAAELGLTDVRATLLATPPISDEHGATLLRAADRLATGGWS